MTQTSVQWHLSHVQFCSVPAEMDDIEVDTLAFSYWFEISVKVDVRVSFDVAVNLL